MAPGAMLDMFLAVARFGPALAVPAVRLANRCRRRTGLPVRLHKMDAHADWHRFGFSRQGSALHLTVSGKSLKVDPGTTLARISAMATVLARCEPGVRGQAEFSDGEHCGDGIVSMCANLAGSILIPDNEFVQSRGYQKLRALTHEVPDFAARRDVVLWRGSSTGGAGAVSLPGMSAGTPGLLARTRLCLLLKDVAGCDVRLSGIAQSGDVLTDVRRLAEAGILGHYINPLEWLNVRYHIAIDGNTLAWSSTFTRLLMGCCIIKPDSAEGYRQWYSSRLRPWQHYVPASTDLDDIVERIEWCRSNVKAAAEIAANGRALALSMDWESELSKAARDISDAHANGMLSEFDG